MPRRGDYRDAWVRRNTNYLPRRRNVEAHTASQARLAARPQTPAPNDATAANAVDGGDRGQRIAVVGRACIVCGASEGVDPAHLIPRSFGGCGDPLCVVPLCRRPYHRAYDSGELDLLPYLEPAWRAQLAHAVGHIGLAGALRRISGSAAPRA